MLTSEFITAGSATFTVSNDIKMRHYTFKISRPKNGDDHSPLFVKLLTGPDNYQDYTYMGIYNHYMNRLILTSKSKFNSFTTPVKVFNWAVDLVKKGKTPPKGYSIQHSGKCGKCGRKLTEPESLKTGIGPICRSEHYSL